MIITGHINYFDVTACGLYKQGNLEPFGCGISESFDLITEWVRDKSLVDTIPWDPAQTRAGLSKCYCRDIYKSDVTGEYLLVLWKSDTDSAGTLWGAQENATTGNGTVVKYTNSYRGTKVVWGRPCYYWIIPELKTIASIKFDHSVCDSELMQTWVSCCINNKVSHPDKRKEFTEKGYVRLSFEHRNENIAARLSYRFDARLRSLSTASAEMLDLATRVTHIVRRETVRLHQPSDDRAAWVKVFDSIPYLNPKPKATTRQVEIRAEAKPTANEIKEIVEKFSKEARKNSDWDNVGFETDTGTVWVDRYRLRHSINVNQDNGNVFTAVELYERLSSKRNDLLGAIRKSIAIEFNEVQRTGTET